ncbi:MAG TPA: oligosaccharide flippase family protein, partial [Polyangiaceae bacterium]|nr:oligosaccharide flippase family protein [Polyangiaceae bacterium]
MTTNTDSADARREVAEVGAAPSPAAPPGGDSARAAGRGGLAIAAAKVSFILVGFIQQLILPRVIDVDGFGAVSRMLSVVSIVNNVMVAMSIQGVSRVVAGAHEGEAPQAYRRALTVHVVVALAAATAFGLLAGEIARRIQAPQAATPLRIAAGVVLAYGVYAPIVGNLNGRKRFLDQAGLDIVYGWSRAALLVTGAWVAAHILGTKGATGAAAGFVIAATLIIPVAIWRGGIGQKGEGGTSTSGYLAYLGPLFVMQLGLNLLLQTDLLLLSEAAGSQARALGLEGPALEKAADEVVGIYRGVQLFGFLPYQILMSV